MAALCQWGVVEGSSETETLLTECEEMSELETLPESEGTTESEKPTENVIESEEMPESEMSAENVPESEGTSESEMPTENVPESEEASESEMLTENVPEIEETAALEQQTELMTESVAEIRMNRAMLLAEKSEADKDDNTDVTATYISAEQAKGLGKGTPDDPYYAEDKYFGSDKEEIVVETVNPQAMIDGVVGIKKFPLAYGLNTITFSVTSADGTKTVYYKFDITRAKKKRPNAMIPVGTLYVQGASAADVADGKICGLDAAETYDYWNGASPNEKHTVSGVTEIANLAKGEYKIKYGETADTAAVSDYSATKIEVVLKADVSVIIGDQNYKVEVQEKASVGERVDFRIKMNAADEWVEKVIWEQTRYLSSGLKVSKNPGVYFTGYVEENGDRYYTGYLIITGAYAMDKSIELVLKNVMTYTGGYYTVSVEGPQNASVKVTPKDQKNAILVNGEYRYKEDSEVTIHVSANQSFGTSELKSFRVYDEAGNIVGTSADGKDITVSVTGNYVVKDIVIEMTPADFTAMEEQLARLDGVDLFDYTDNTRVVVEQKVKLSEQMYKLTQKDQDYLDDFVAELKSAIDNLTVKAGDFTKANEVIAKIPLNLETGIYVDETVKRVQDAKQALDTAIAEGWDRLHQAEIDALAETLESALDALQLKKADYTAVEEAKSKVLSDLSIYTDETVKALEDALAAVEPELDITEQDKVDAMAQRILAALEMLEEKEEAETETESETEKKKDDKDKSQKPSDSSDKKTKAAKTGDETNLAGWGMMCLVSGGILLFFLRRRRVARK